MVIVKTLHILHHPYTVRQGTGSCFFFLVLKYFSYKSVSRSPEKGDTSQKGNLSLGLMT
jgi:hypothetical protein